MPMKKISTQYYLYLLDKDETIILNINDELNKIDQELSQIFSNDNIPVVKDSTIEKILLQV